MPLSLPLKLSSSSLALVVAAMLCAAPASAETSAKTGELTAVELTSAGSTAPGAKRLEAPVPVDAKALLEDLGSAERIQRSGSLRMLSQRISATTCNRVAGIATADADKYLTRSLRDYRRILAGLEGGDAGLGLYGAEEDRRILRRIGLLNKVWAPLDTVFNDVSNDALTAEHATLVATTVPVMLDVSKRLVSDVAAEYSDPTQMLQADAVLLQIAERQRMLEQEIANASCMIAEGIEVDAARTKLSEAVSMYDVSLGALRNGMPEAGVAAPPTKAIDLWLGDIAARWSDARPVLDAIAAGGEVSTEDRTFIFEEMNKLTWMMNVTVGQYTEASKLNY